MRQAFALFAALVVGSGCLSLDDLRGEPVDDVRYEGIEFVTDLGTFTAILFPNETPETASFMKDLVRRKYYDGREFNRVIPGFVIQEVDRTGGTTDQPDRVVLEAETEVYFSGGALGIARGADPDSGGSEFFVMDFAAAHLYRNYTAWGQVVEGLDVVHAIARVPAVQQPRPPASVPSVPVSPPEQAPEVGVHDRQAVRPAKILRAGLVDVTLPFDEARRYPLVVGQFTVVPGARFVMEWGRDLQAGRETEGAWYVFNGVTGTIDASRMNITATFNETLPANETAPAPQPLAVTPDASDPRILHWAWTPARAGNWTVVLRNETALAQQDVHVPVRANATIVR